MTKFLRAFFLSLTITAIMLFSAIGTTTAYADDETPTPVGKDITVKLPDGQSQDTGIEASESQTALSGEDVNPSKNTLSLLNQIPDNTTVTVLNSDGGAMYLASQSTAEALASGEFNQIWCPASQTPIPGVNGCTGFFNSMDELLTFLKDHESELVYQQAGTIFIQKDQYQSSETSIDFNTYGFNTLNSYALTLQGGWNTADYTLNPADTTLFTVPIIIGTSLNPWAGALTINNISISGASGDAGLTLITSSEVSLSNVTADNNSLAGAHIEASDIAIDTASFNNNGASGLDATSQGAIALFGVNANNNQQFGANVFAGNVVAIAQSNFNDNEGYGLRVVTTGLISVEDVNANNNALYGAYIEGDNTVISNSFFTANGSLGVVSEPVGYGLQIVSTGTVNLNHINSADSVGNQLFGADITAAENVNISNSFFSGQQSEIFIPCDETTNYYGYGLNVGTPDDVFLNYVVANYNNLWGASLTGNDVTVYNSQFNNNVTDSVLFIDDTGLLVNASGYVDIYKTEAKENRLIGATVTAVGDVFIADSNFSDNRGITCNDDTCEDYNAYGYGLNVSSAGNIYVSGTTANNNYLFGATLSGANVEVTNSTFNFNGSCIERTGVQSLIVNCIDPTGQGLIITSSGNTSLVNVTASNNELFGANVHAVGNVTVTASIFSGNKSYTYFDDGDFDTNGYGLQVVANGDILLNADANGVGNTASDNGEDGAILIGQSTVTVSDSIFNNNGHSGGNNGLSVTATGGDVTLNNVTASNNHGQDGVNVTGACTYNVFVNGGTFANNDRYGLKIKLSTLVLDGTQTFANNVVGNFFTNSNTCP